MIFTSNREDGKTYNYYIANLDGSKLKKITSLPAGSVAYWENLHLMANGSISMKAVPPGLLD